MGKKNLYYQVFIDRLEITYTATDDIRKRLSEGDEFEYSEKEFWLERVSTSAARNYKNQFVIWYNDIRTDDEGSYYVPRILGYLYFESYNTYRQDVYISFENSILYDPIMLGARFYIEDEMGLKFKQISKLDISVDFNFNIQRKMLRLYKDIDYDLIVYGKKADNSCIEHIGFMSFNNPRNRIFANAEMLSSNGASINFKTYNKKKEIEQTSGKYYIIERFVPTSTMYRIEISAENHKAVAKTLKSLGMTEEELYTGLDIEDTLLDVFNNIFFRIIHLSKNRQPISFIEEVLRIIRRDVSSWKRSQEQALIKKRKYPVWKRKKLHSGAIC